jgi:hypothetical protein
MAISFPRTDIMTFVRYGAESVPLRLVSRQESSRTAGGVTRGKDLGPALWVGEFTTVPLPIAKAVAFEAMLASLDGVIGTFEAGDPRRPYPAEHADGDFNDTGTLTAVHESNKAIQLASLDVGFTLSVGDFLVFTCGSSRALHQVMESVTANGAGATGYFEVRPHIRSGYTLPAAVTLKRPKGIFTLQPNSVVPRSISAVNGVVSFKAIQHL